ncbi:hypothetical protein [Cylindrospermopsis curvispora]|uniref:Uncharacterized protein n=1 Tax=Cylindrospermopsis curvispora GIHE-G1 TaxID=2666332 RepID=A0A7H0EYM3_9CYAN|nr:hypothetical protein [Cylindrospermopsis curvispora]QNP28889.1 hypothetical protein IAR63_13590 [Cylindrospermopsis curvispora GIHE-G1]
MLREIASHSQWAIAKHSLRDLAFSVPPGSFSREKPERVDKRLRSTPFGRSRSIPYGRLRSTRYARSHYILNGRSLSSRCISYSVPIWENIDGKRFSSKDKSVISRGWGYLEGDCAALPLGDRIQGSPCFFSRENFEGVIGKR